MPPYTKTEIEATVWNIAGIYSNIKATYIFIVVTEIHTNHFYEWMEEVLVSGVFTWTIIFHICMYESHSHLSWCFLLFLCQDSGPFSMFRALKSNHAKSFRLCIMIFIIYFTESDQEIYVSHTWSFKSPYHSVLAIAWKCPPTFQLHIRIEYMHKLHVNSHELSLF